MLFIVSKMRPQIDSFLNNTALSIRRVLKQSSNRRTKVFFDSPGLLEQSQHWGGLVILTIASGTTAVLLWAFIGKVDQTVSAIGSLTPASGKTTVSSPSAGIVRKLFVRDGETVAKGSQLLIVESEGTQARLDSTSRRLEFYRYENQLYNLLLDHPGSFSIDALPAPPYIIQDEDRTRSIQLTVQETASRLNLFKARLDSQAVTLKLKQGLVDSLRPLYENGGLAKFSYLNSIDELQQLKARMLESEQQMTTVISQAGRQVNANVRQILSLEAQKISLQEQNRNLTLRAQRSGTIFNVSVSPGSVISSGSEVMRIIPEAGGLRANVFLPNSQLGFVQPGMDVKLAISSFPPGEYGYLKGSIIDIGADALEDNDQQASDRRRANTFPMTIALGPNDDKHAVVSRLVPGMQVSANIIVRQRPVITLLTDVFTKGSESLQNSR